jgi:hypothetical protein
MKMKHGLIGLGVAMGLFLAACDSGDGVTAVNSTDLIGKWNMTQQEFHSVTKVSGGSVTIPDQKYDTVENLAGQGDYVEFKNDNTYSANFPSNGNGAAKTSAIAAVETGTWSVAGNTVTTISSDKKDTLAMVAAISGKSGTFTASKTESSVEAGYTYSMSYTAIFTATKE